MQVPDHMHAAAIAIMAWIMEGRFHSSMSSANVLMLHEVNSSRQDIRKSRFSSNLNAFCRLDSAWCIGLCIGCVHHDVNQCIHVRQRVYVFFWMHTCRRLYTTVQCTGIPHWLQTVHFDNNYTPTITTQWHPLHTAPSTAAPQLELLLAL
jgi:hypothetical protein